MVHFVVQQISELAPLYTKSQQIHCFVFLLLTHVHCLSFTEPLSYTNRKYRSAKFCSSESSPVDIGFVTTGIHSADVVWRVAESLRIIAPCFLLLQNTCDLVQSYLHLMLAHFLYSMTTNTELRILKQSASNFCLSPLGS